MRGALACLSVWAVQTLRVQSDEDWNDGFLYEFVLHMLSSNSPVLPLASLPLFVHSCGSPVVRELVGFLVALSDCAWNVATFGEKVETQSAQAVTRFETWRRSQRFTKGAEMVLKKKWLCAFFRLVG